MESINKVFYTTTLSKRQAVIKLIEKKDHDK